MGGSRQLPAPGKAASGAGRGPRAAQGAPGPATPRPRCLLAFPAARARRGRRSPGAVAGRGVQGALWPSGAGGWSGHRGARGFAEPVRLQRLGRPAVACAPRRAPPRSPGPAWLRRPRSRCGWRDAGPQPPPQRPQPPQECEVSRRSPVEEEACG